MYSKLDSHQLDLVFVIFYRIWCRMNAFVFNDSLKSPGVVLTFAKNELSDYVQVHQVAGISKAMSQGGPMDEIWQPSVRAPFKVNFDASLDKNKGKAVGLKVVVRNVRGKMQVGRSTPMNSLQLVFLAESLALLNATELCADLGLHQVHFKGNTKLVIEAVLSSTADESWLGQVIEDIKFVKAKFCTMVFFFCS